MKVDQITIDRLRELVAAGENVNALLAAGYIGPAAVVAGCVLEDSLTKLAESHGIARAARPKL